MGEEELTYEGRKDTVLEETKGNIIFKNVQFGYEKDKKVINNFSASARSGQKIAIVGPTGAGKTTIVNLLMKFYEMIKGKLL